MRDRDTITDLLKDTYTKHPHSGNPDNSLDYITYMTQIELLCDIRDLLSDIKESRKPQTRMKRPLH